MRLIGWPFGLFLVLLLWPTVSAGKPLLGQVALEQPDDLPRGNPLSEGWEVWAEGFELRRKPRPYRNSLRRSRKQKRQAARHALRSRHRGAVTAATAPPEVVGSACEVEAPSERATISSKEEPSGKSSLPLDPAFYSILCLFAGCLTAPSFENFVILITGWVLCVKRRTVTGMIEAAGVADTTHHERFHRFFSKARWPLDELSKILLTTLVARFVPPGQPIRLGGDDTLAKKTGRKIFGTGRWRDAVLSTKAVVVTRWGLNFVVLSLTLSVPLWPNRSLGFPFMARLHRKEKSFKDPSQYRTPSQLLLEMVTLVAGWLPDRTFHLAVDGAYANEILLKGLPSNVVLISRTRTDATLYELAPPRTGKRGAPRKKGDKLPKPRELAVSSTITWTPVKVTLYGLERNLEVYSFVGLWYHVAKGRPLKFVLVRDPKDPTDWLCLFSTDTTLLAITILEIMGGRWSIEVAFREAKQSLGAEHPQSRLPKAVERQFPLGLMLVSLVKLWFVSHGHQTRFAVMSSGPWNRHKTEPSFSDMLAALRRAGWAQRISSDSASVAELRKILEVLIDQLAQAA